jgi:hypothetical protein
MWRTDVRKRPWLVLAVLVTGIALIGCGGGSSGSKGAGASPAGGNDEQAGGGGGGGTPPGGTPANFRVLEEGAGSAILIAELAVARDMTEYGALWSRHRPPPPPGVGAPVEAPPAVDFATEIVVGIFLGGRPTTGFSVAILAAEWEGNGIRIDWEERQPGTGCVVSPAITHPYLLAAVSRTEGPVDFNGKVTTIDCP